MRNNIIQLSKVASSNCGGVGAWIDNPLSSPNPSGSLWRGFQLGGGKRKMIKMRKMRKMRKTRQVRKKRMSRKTRRKTKTSS